MLNGMTDSVMGCLKEEIRMDVISNNLANSTVIGFKKDRVSFKDLLDSLEQETSTSSIITNNEGDSMLVSIKCDLEQGDLRESGNQLDFAISGKGFFKVETPSGLRFTRKGNFQVDGQGRIITQDGHLVLGKGGPIGLPPATRVISVDQLGNISADDTKVGQFDLVDFKNYDGLIKEGSGFFVNLIGDPGQAAPLDTRLKQGYVEMANVEVADEMVQMIHSMRAFESYQKAIQVLDGINNRAVNEVSRLR